MNQEDPEQLTPLIQSSFENDPGVSPEIRPNRRGSRDNVQINIRTEMTNLVNRSLTLNLLQILFSTLKIAVSLFVLLFYHKRCNVPLEIWICFMMSNDFLHICSLTMSIHYTIRLGQAESNANVQRRDRNEQNRNSNISENENGHENDDLERQDMRNYDLLRNFEENNRCYYWFKELIKIYYIALLIWGHVLLFLVENDCKEAAPGLTLLILIFLIFGYFYIFYPVLVVVAVCLCLPVLIIAALYFGGRGQQPADNSAIEKIPKVKYYKKDFVENTCVICQTEFEEEEEVIKLPCPNAAHVFHTECVTRWLKINGICPVCRHKI